MKLLLAVYLSCTLLYTAESLRCHVCDNDRCDASTSVVCPASSTVCKTATSVKLLNESLSIVVNKSCSTLQSCNTPIGIETEWSANVDFERESRTQICCVTDNCNFPTLAIPNSLINGKRCPSCASLATWQAGTCNSNMTCAGVEDTCFTVDSSSGLRWGGCISRNLCTKLDMIGGVLTNTEITCGAPWSIRIRTALLITVLFAYKILV